MKSDIIQLLKECEAELARLETEGWVNEDFAKALKNTLEEKCLYKLELNFNSKCNSASRKLVEKLDKAKIKAEEDYDIQMAPHRYDFADAYRKIKKIFKE